MRRYLFNFRIQNYKTLSDVYISELKANTPCRPTTVSHYRSANVRSRSAYKQFRGTASILSLPHFSASSVSSILIFRARLFWIALTRPSLFIRFTSFCIFTPFASRRRKRFRVCSLSLSLHCARREIAAAVVTAAQQLFASALQIVRARVVSQLAVTKYPPPPLSLPSITHIFSFRRPRALHFTFTHTHTPLAFASTFILCFFLSPFFANFHRPSLARDLSTDSEVVAATFSPSHRVGERGFFDVGNSRARFFTREEAAAAREL